MGANLILQNKVLRVIVVGCGNIAGGFDMSKVDLIHPLTHAGAYKNDGRFKIVACVDPDDVKRERFMAHWGVPIGVKRLEDLDGLQIFADVYSICSPTSLHPQHIEMALKFGPRLIFCEKPISLDYSISESIVKKCRDAKTLLMVNYTRRWDPSVIALKQEIASCKRGELRGVMAIYNKGLFNNGSHMVDLLGYLLGSIKVLSAGKKKFDFFENDPSITAQLEAQNEVSILLSCANARDFSIFESQFIFSNSVMTMENGGLFWRERKVDGSFEFFGYRELSEGIRTKGGYGKAMLNAIDNIYSAVTAEHEMRSNGESALHTQKLCCEIFTSSLNS